MQAPRNLSIKPLTLAVLSTVLLAGCGGSDNNDNNSNTSNPAPNNKTGVASLTTGKLLEPSVNTSNFTAAELNNMMKLVMPNFQAKYDAPVCGVKVEYIHYDTVDVKGNPTDATGAVFIPTGSDIKCSGQRPVVLHAHGTATTQGYNFAEVGNPKNEAGSTAALVAATFAGQGFVVISPNYAGYDKSKLSYHPYLNAQQQSHEMADALKAGREVINNLSGQTKVNDNGKLFLTGYSQGGHVAMAAARYLEQLKEPVTAAMPISGPYAMEAFGDAMFGGKVVIGATFFAPLMARNYQEQYGDIYKDPSDIFASINAKDVPNLLPTKEANEAALVLTGKLPATAMFQKAPTGNADLDALSPADATFAYGFDPQRYLIQTNYRAAYVADMKKNPDWAIPYLQGMAGIVPTAASMPENPLRKALKANDLRGYQPNFPVVLCGGNQDPTVFFDVNTGIVNNLWKANNTASTMSKFGVIDIDTSNQSTRQQPIYQTRGLTTMMDNQLKADAATMQDGFTQNINQMANVAARIAAQAPNSTPASVQAAARTAVLTQYHSTVTPYCMGVAERMFNQF